MINLNGNQVAQGVKDILQEVIKVAAEEGRLEEARLGRSLTQVEASKLADMVMRQFETALVMVKV